jgi:hypothetical protein
MSDALMVQAVSLINDFDQRRLPWAFLSVKRAFICSPDWSEYDQFTAIGKASMIDSLVAGEVIETLGG